MESLGNDDVSSLNARMESLGNDNVSLQNARKYLVGNACDVTITVKFFMTSNLLWFIVITKTISHYFSQFIYNYSLVPKAQVVLEKCLMATLPVYMKYQFKLYPFLSLYSTILYCQSEASFRMI